MSKEEKGKQTSKKINIIIILILLITGIYFYSTSIATTGLNIKEYKINATSISDEYDGFKIVQISDIHYGNTVMTKELKNLVKKVNNQKPDIIVFTGDLIDKTIKLNENEINNIVKILKKLDAGIEIIAVKGEHDYHKDYFDKISEKLEWHVLNNTYEYVYYKNDKPLVFVGLEDLEKGKSDYDNAFSYVNEIGNDNYTIVLSHEPDQIDKYKSYDFDIALAGHSHLGQVRVPLVGAIYTPKGSKKYYDNHYKINNSDLYISGGIGTTAINVRFFNKPSINLYRFYTK